MYFKHKLADVVAADVGHAAFIIEPQRLLDLFTLGGALLSRERLQVGGVRIAGVFQPIIFHQLGKIQQVIGVQLHPVEDGDRIVNMRSGVLFPACPEQDDHAHGDPGGFHRMHGLNCILRLARLFKET